MKKRPSEIVVKPWVTEIDATMEIHDRRPAIAMTPSVGTIDFEAITRFDSPFAPTAPRLPVTRSQRLPRPRSLPIPDLRPPERGPSPVSPMLVGALLVLGFGALAFIIASYL